MSDKIDIKANLHQLEFMNFTEIVNDLISNLHNKDRQYIESISKYDLIAKERTWREHIRAYYSLWHPENPLTFKTEHPVNPDIVSKNLVEAVWDAIHHSYYPTNYA